MNKEVSSIFSNFVEATTCLIPFFEAANLPWKNSDSYEEWENVISSLFSGLVANPCLYYLYNDNIPPKAIFKSYDLMFHRNFNHCLYVNGKVNGIFHSLKIEERNITSLELLLYDEKNKVIGRELQSVSIKDCEFTVLKMENFKWLGDGKNENWFNSFF